jgi:hypothetical protein
LGSFGPFWACRNVPANHRKSLILLENQALSLKRVRIPRAVQFPPLPPKLSRKFGPFSQNPNEGPGFSPTTAFPKVFGRAAIRGPRKSCGCTDPTKANFRRLHDSQTKTERRSWNGRLMQAEAGAITLTVLGTTSFHCNLSRLPFPPYEQDCGLRVVAPATVGTLNDAATPHEGAVLDGPSRPMIEIAPTSASASFQLRRDGDSGRRIATQTLSALSEQFL